MKNKVATVILVVGIILGGFGIYTQTQDNEIIEIGDMSIDRSAENNINWMEIVGGALVLTSTYRMNRFVALFDPFDERVYKFAGWQPAHSIMGLASGGLWGSGLGASKQKWANLAEAHTDFIFSVIGEELGLLGSLLVLTLYAALIYSILRVALKTKDNLSRYACAGIACWFIAQITINIGSVTSLLPVIGVTLPLISYGGSSLLANLIALGFVLGVARRTPEISEGIKASRMRKVSQ